MVVTFTCSGTGSTPCPSPVTVTTEGAGQVVTGRFTDLAGHTSEASVTLNIDKSTPTVSALATPAPNGAGWNRTDVIVSFTCSDSLSGIGTCPAPVTASAESAGQTIAGTAVDKAGNSADASALVRIDRTPPAIVASVLPSPSADGWIHSDATVTFVCSDGGSGVATCPAPVTLTSEGANQVVSGTATKSIGRQQRAQRA